MNFVRLPATSRYRALLQPLRLALLAGVMMTNASCGAVPVGTVPFAGPSSVAVAAPTRATPPASPTARPAPRPTLPPTSVPTLSPLPSIERRPPTVLPTLARSPITTSLSPTVPPVLSLEQRQQIFEEVWRTVKDHYLYADFRGLDWDALREEYEPRLAFDQSRDQFYAMMAEMVAHLDDHHSRFVAPSAVLTEDAVASGREITVGIGVVAKPKPDGAFIQLVFPDSPAERAGLRPRDRIIAVDGRPYTIEDGDLEGPEDSTTRLTVVRPGEKKPRDVVLTRQEVQTHILPAYQRFPGDIGYVSVPTLWVNDMDEQVSGALTDLRATGQLDGLILDVRSNTGGWGHVLSGILSHFVRGQVGVFFDRRHERPLEVEQPAGPDLRHVPLVVLVDGDTASYAEVLAAVLQRERHALVVGAPTAGNTETIYPYTLSDGSRLWLAQEGFRLQNGVNLEGTGVQPDEVVDVDWTRYSEDDDPQLLEALRLLGAGPK
jgi:carboxyl-terminal processing protease